MTASIIPIRPFETPVVYGKTKGCPGCFATKRHLDNQGTAYIYIDTDQDEEAAAMLRAEGFTQAPVVKVGGQSWTGYRPDKLDELAFTPKEHKAAA